MMSLGAAMSSGRRSREGHGQQRHSSQESQGGGGTAVGKNSGAEQEGERLPGLASIQASFGRHDVSGVRAHIGGSAAEDAYRLDARAFATGDRVAFAHSPDLFTAAHEAAHVVQQRAGVDHPDESHEQHADAVAHAVVRGESAEPLLNHITGSGSSAPRPVIQRKAATSSPKDPKDELALYLSIHETSLRDAIVMHFLNDVTLPDPARDITWTRAGEREFVKRVIPPIVARVGNSHSLRTLLHPEDPEFVFRKLPLVRNSNPSDLLRAWHPHFGLQIAGMVERVVNTSLTKRLGPQYRLIVASRAELPGIDDLTPSHPIDPIVARALVEESVLDTSSIAATETVPPSKPTAVSVSWLGHVDPSLWNFVRVSPASARVVDVAATLWGPRKTTMAFAVQKYGDLFRIAPAHARAVIAARYPNEVVGTADTDASAAIQLLRLASSRVGTGDAAPRQFERQGTAAQDEAPTHEQLAEVERAIGRRLDAILAKVTPFGMSEILTTAYDARIDRRARLANADEATRRSWAPVLQFQHAQLLAIEPRIASLASQLNGPQSTKKGSQTERTETLQKWVTAAAISHLRDESTAIVAGIIDVEQRRQDDDELVVISDVRETTKDVTSIGEHAHPGVADAEQQVVRHRRAKMLGLPRGNSPYDRQKALTIAGSAALENRIIAAEHALTQLSDAAKSAGFADAEAFRKIAPRVKLVPELISDVRGRLAEVYRAWEGAEREGTPTIVEDTNAPDDWAEWQGKTAGLSAARTAFAKIAGDRTLAKFIDDMREKIRDQAITNALTTLAAALLLTVATGMGAAAISSRVSAALVGEATGLARIAKGAIDVSINVSINSLVQLAMSDGPKSIGWTMLENALMELATRGMLQGLHRANQTAVREAHALATLPHLSAAERHAVASIDFSGAELTFNLLGNSAAQWAAHRLIEKFHTTPDQVTEPFAMVVMQQGAAIGVGKFLHSRIGAWRQHRAALEATRVASLTELRALVESRDQLYRDAEALGESLSPDPAAAERLAQRDAMLLRQERQLLATRADHSSATRPSEPAVVPGASHQSEGGARDVLLEVPAEIFGEAHTVKARRNDSGGVDILLCSDCDVVRAKIDQVLAVAPGKGPEKSLRTRLIKLRQKVVAVEEDLRSGTPTQVFEARSKITQIAAHLRDLSQALQNKSGVARFPSAKPLCFFCAFEAAVDYEALARSLGFELIGARSHGQPVYRKGREYISPDVDGHNGGIWKKATGSAGNLGRKTTRDGTYNYDLTKKIGP